MTFSDTVELIHTLYDGTVFSFSFVMNLLGMTLLTEDQQHMNLYEEVRGLCPNFSWI